MIFPTLSAHKCRLTPAQQHSAWKPKIVPTQIRHEVSGVVIKNASVTNDIHAVNSPATIPTQTSKVPNKVNEPILINIQM